MRNFLATLLLSQGTPMLLAGDEFARTQQGNNNAYCQDNAISWVDWRLAQHNRAQVRFVQRLTGLRHQFPILRRNRFLTGDYDSELDVKDLTWINASGAEMRAEEWADNGMRCFGMLMDGRARPTGVRQRGTEATMLLILNAHHEAVNFTLPTLPGGDSWKLLLDTDVAESEASVEIASGKSRAVKARSLLLFVLGALS
jgi:glycogen operon protein